MVGSLVSLFTLQVTHRIDADTDIDIERDHIVDTALDVLILLALSSLSAAGYARRNERAGRLVRS